MPYKTKHYSLEAFRRGDTYSSVVDERRFTIIDNEMAFVSDRIGSGLIEGWGITNNEDGTVTVSSGMGHINRRVVESFGGIKVTLSNNTIHYFFMEAKKGVVGGLSGNSNIVSITASDDVPPLSPQGIKKEDSISGYLSSLPSFDDDFVNYLRSLMNRGNEDDSLELIPYKELAFSWSPNLEPDFSHYNIYRNSGSDILFLGSTVELIFVDIDLVQDTNYEYQVTAVDLSGNESSSANISNISSFTISTDVDERVPSPPIFVQLFPGDSNLQIIWDNSPTDNVPTYRIALQLLNDNYESDGDPIVVDVSSDSVFGSTYVIFEGLANNRKYDITVFSVSLSGVLSEGILQRILLEGVSGAV